MSDEESLLQFINNVLESVSTRLSAEYFKIYESRLKELKMDNDRLYEENASLRTQLDYYESDDYDIDESPKPTKLPWDFIYIVNDDEIEKRGE